MISLTRASHEDESGEFCLGGRADGVEDSLAVGDGKA
jgi:hypothetical protein